MFLNFFTFLIKKLYFILTKKKTEFKSNIKLTVVLFVKLNNKLQKKKKNSWQMEKISSVLMVCYRFLFSLLLLPNKLMVQYVRAMVHFSGWFQAFRVKLL